MNIRFTLCLLALLFGQGLLFASSPTVITNGTNDVTKECTGKKSGLYPYPMNCSLYVSCDGKGNGSVRACKTNNHFHPEYKVCVWEQIYPCAGRKKSNEISQIILYCQRKTQGVYKHPQRCDSYVICSKEGAYHMKCPPSLLFDSERNKCDKAANVLCDVNSHNKSAKRIADSSIKKLCVGKKAGKIFEDPDNCNGYIACTGLSVIRMKCPEGLWYDQISNKCDLPTKVHCTLNRTHPLTSIMTSSTRSPISIGSTRRSTGRRGSTMRPPISSSSGDTNKTNHDTINKSETAIPLKKVSSPTFSCKGRKPGKYAMKDACQYFYSCEDKGEATLKKCPKHTNFHPVYRNCVWTYVYSCDDPKFCRGKSDGKYLNPNNCYGYFQCAGGRTFPRNCDPGLRYNGRHCVDASQYICVKSPISLTVV